MSADTTLILFVLCYLAANLHKARGEVSGVIVWGGCSLFLLYLFAQKVNAI